MQSAIDLDKGKCDNAGVLSSRVMRRIESCPDAAHALGALADTTAGDFFLVGGLLRRALFNECRSGDLDIMLPNADDRGFGALDSLGLTYTLNSNGHRRYKLKTTHIDIYQPNSFFVGFPDVIKSLKFFDLKISALGMHFGSRAIVDPFGVLNRLYSTDPGVNWYRWEAMDTKQVSILAIRLVKLLSELPHLRVPTADAKRLIREILPVIADADWATLKWRFPLGREAFVRTFSAEIRPE